MKKHKILIIKVGYSETLDAEISTITSFGDVLRSTVLLNLYKEDHVTWLVDERALPVLKGNPYIDRILIYNLTSVLQLQAEHFDTVINLEKVPGLCALADSVNAWRRYGFRLDVNSGEAEAYDHSHDALEGCRDIDKKRKREAYWQESLFEMVGAQWKGEEYVLGYKPKTKEQHDIGFNCQVGDKWPLKGWPMASWKQLEASAGKKYSISWQQGLHNMEDYFEWINSCRLLISNDSFGLHIALALKKKVIVIFGPTRHREIYFYDSGKALHLKDLDCEFFPCRLDTCQKYKDKDGCIAQIKVADVMSEIDKIFIKDKLVLK